MAKIKHVVQLMLENRSFDQMLGFLYEGKKTPNGQEFEGLTGEESNPDETGRNVKIYKIKPEDPHPYLMPGADPGEGFGNTNYQLFGTDDPAPGRAPTNKGFLINFKAAIATDQSKGYKDTIEGTDPSGIMGVYPPEMIPVMSSLAREYAVCDLWFSSVPTQTIPNRAFAAAASSQGRLDNHVKIFTCPSIFGRLSDAGKDWAIYGYNRDPLTRMDFPDTLHADERHFGHFRDFQERAKEGKLPEYTFLEPSFGASGNSQHPNYDVAAGEQLIHDVYYALRANPEAWNATLLIITYDEHGGNYDHVPPPMDDRVRPPNDGTLSEVPSFGFNRLGVRIPAVLVSPWIKKGTVFRAAPDAGHIDHTSVLRTIHDLFGTKTLTERDAAAPSLLPVLTLERPRIEDPIEGVKPPISNAPLHPNSSRPSKLEELHARRVSQLPIRNDHGYYDSEEPDLATSADFGSFIRDRTAAWSQHRQRQLTRRARNNPPPASPTAEPIAEPTTAEPTQQ
jgi:phospholipase C